MIIFYESGEFKWYSSQADLEDNYYIGTYEIHMGESALDYVINDLKEFGVTEDEMDDPLERYGIENYCCLVLNNEMVVMDGEEKTMGTNSYYMGFCADGVYDMVNMKTANYMTLSRMEK